MKVPFVLLLIMVMAGNQQWNEETLKVNKENGYLSYVNTGSGTTNNSYWNATVVVSADGFEAENIIFENSYNQYISKKESEDVVVEWVTGGKAHVRHKWAVRQYRIRAL